MAQFTTRDHVTATVATETARDRLLAGVPMTERRLRLAGISTAVLEGGEGPPLVLLHGPGEYALKWRWVAPDLTTSYRVIAPDLPGHGASDPLEGQPDLERMIAWVDDLIECTCSAPPVLIGHLIGGAIAARFAAARGERLRALVLVDSLGLSAFQPAPHFGQALMAYLSDPTEKSHDDLWRLCAFDLESVRHRMGDQWENLKAYNLDRIRVPAVGAALQAFIERYGIPAIPAAELARITVPTSLIWGRHDLATPLSAAQDASARYGWPLKVIEGAADEPAVEQPEAFVRALRAVIM